MLLHFYVEFLVSLILFVKTMISWRNFIIQSWKATYPSMMTTESDQKNFFIWKSSTKWFRRNLMNETVLSHENELHKPLKEKWLFLADNSNRSSTERLRCEFQWQSLNLKRLYFSSRAVWFFFWRRGTIISLWALSQNTSLIINKSHATKLSNNLCVHLYCLNESESVFIFWQLRSQSRKLWWA